MHIQDGNKLANNKSVCRLTKAPVRERKNKVYYGKVEIQIVSEMENLPIIL